jgi:hypothetical protein
VPHVGDHGLPCAPDVFKGMIRIFLLILLSCIYAYFLGTRTPKVSSPAPPPPPTLPNFDLRPWKEVDGDYFLCVGATKTSGEEAARLLRRQEARLLFNPLSDFTLISQHESWYFLQICDILAEHCKVHLQPTFLFSPRSIKGSKNIFDLFFLFDKERHVLLQDTFHFLAGWMHYSPAPVEALSEDSAGYDTAFKHVCDALTEYLKARDRFIHWRMKLFEPPIDWNYYDILDIVQLVALLQEDGIHPQNTFNKGLFQDLNRYSNLYSVMD